MAFEGPPKNAKVEREKKEEDKLMATEKAPFVSGLYRPEEDAGKKERQIKDLPNLKEIQRERHRNQMSKRYFYPSTPETRRITKRMLGERDDD